VGEGVRHKGDRGRVLRKLLGACVGHGKHHYVEQDGRAAGELGLAAITDPPAPLEPAWLTKKLLCRSKRVTAEAGT
jgi:hypothetical protein